MAKRVIDESTLTNIGDAIREKLDITELIPPENMPSKIRLISGGSTSLLPSGYTQVEYIEGTGTQYIDTGFKPAYNSRVVADVSGVTTEDFIFGARDTASSTAANQFGVYVSSASKLRSDYFGTNASVTPSDIAARTVIDKNANIVTAYGLTITNTAVSSGAVNNSLFLFALNNVGTVTAQASMKLYACKIYDNGTLVRDFIPCTNANGEGGLYDIINSVFYENVGTGVFSVGATITTTAEHILSGHSVNVGGKNVIGTMPNNGAGGGTISKKAGTVAIPEGYYDGSGSVAIDSTEKSKIIAGNIKSGVTLLGVAGTYAGGYIVITGTVPDEGKSVVTANLASIFAKI